MPGDDIIIAARPAAEDSLRRNRRGEKAHERAFACALEGRRVDVVKARNRRAHTIAVLAWRLGACLNVKYGING